MISSRIHRSEVQLRSFERKMAWTSENSGEHRVSPQKRFPRGGFARWTLRGLRAVSRSGCCQSGRSAERGSRRDRRRGDGRSTRRVKRERLLLHLGPSSGRNDFYRNGTSFPVFLQVSVNVEFEISMNFELDAEHLESTTSDFIAE